MIMIGFNKPHITGNEFKYISQAIALEKLSGNGIFTKKCHSFFEDKYKFPKCLLTHSATAALEMAAILADIKPGDEVILPSYTFVSTANAFLLRGATLVFCDSSNNNPNIDVSQLESIITYKTKIIVVVHYAGVGCDMDAVLSIASKRNLLLIEDAAQSIDSFYKNRPLGSFGHFAAFSFHETKNITAGEGGMLVINDERYIQRAEIIWEKGTNRASFYRGETSKYCWVDIGSSFLPSELTAAFLFAQLESLELVQQRRRYLWDRYYNLLTPLHTAGKVRIPNIIKDNNGNAHIFYILTENINQRDELLSYLQQNEIQAIFHYLALHRSPYFKRHCVAQVSLINAERFDETLIRLPLYHELTDSQINFIVDKIIKFYDY
jgi:dTDP-4-amino-4,6-dideoxygalactose transaminase